MRKILFVGPLFALAAMPALACTQEEFQQKATDVSAAMQAAVMKNPQSAAEWGQKMQDAGMKGATSLDEACKMYDDIMIELKKLP